MLFFRNLFIGSFFFIFFPANHEVLGQDAISITQQLFTNVKSIRSIQYTFESKERLLQGKTHIEKSFFKINVSPLKIYLYQHYPKKGLQCLYLAGQNNDKVRVNPNSFPWVNMNLEPESELMLQDRHHSIYDAGFNYTISLLEFLLTKYQSQKDKLVTLNGIEKVEGADCYHLTFINSNYRLTLYTTQANETPLSIAKKLHLNFYSIMENNSSLKPVSVIKPGTRLIVPNDYASKMELYVHKEKLYPVYLKVYDDRGLFEEFSFQQVILNPAFKEMDFSDKNPSYKF